MAGRAASGGHVGLPPTGAHRNLTAHFLRLRDASRAHTRPFGAAKGAARALRRQRSGEAQP